MAGFLYYVPGVQQGHYEAHPEELAKLFPQLADAIVAECGVTSGPLGKPQGVVVYVRRPTAPQELPPEVGLHPDKQTWVELPNGTALGYINERLPGPLDVARKVQFPGYEVSDPSGNVWSIPIARASNGRSSLPDHIVFDNDGNPIREPKAEYAWLWEASGKAWDALQSNDEVDVDWSARVALRTLGMCRMGRPVLDTSTVAAILYAVIDWQAVDEFDKQQKKTDDQQPADSLSSTTGTGDDTPISPQVAAN